MGICLPFKAPISWEHFLLLHEATPARPPTPTTAGDYLSSPWLNEEEEAGAGGGGGGGGQTRNALLAAESNTSGGFKLTKKWRDDLN